MDGLGEAGGVSQLRETVENQGSEIVTRAAVVQIGDLAREISEAEATFRQWDAEG